MIRLRLIARITILIMGEDGKEMVKKAGRPSGTENNKSWVAKGVRLSKEEWEKLDKIADDLSVTLSIELNTSSMVRKAVIEFINKYEKVE